MSIESSPGFRKHPNYQMTITPANLSCEVRAAGQLLATSQNAMRLDEAKYPPVYYLPFADVNRQLLTPSTTETYCPFKGTASYWHLTLDAASPTPTVDDILWCYANPYPQAQAIAGYAAFYMDRIDGLEVKPLP